MITGFDVGGREIILIYCSTLFIHSGEYPAECLIINPLYIKGALHLYCFHVKPSKFNIM